MDHERYCTGITLIYFIYILQNQSIVILWLTLRLSNQCLSIKNVIKDRHSRSCLSCSTPWLVFFLSLYYNLNKIALHFPIL